MIILLTLAYVAIAVLLLSLNLESLHSGRVKIFAIVVVSLFYFFSYYGWRSFSGLPSSESLPDNFRLVWLTVDEPDKITGSDGAVYIWLRELSANLQKPVGEPRAYRLSYSENLAEEVEAAIAELEAGKQLNGGRSRQQFVDEDIPADDNTNVQARTGEYGSQSSGSYDQRIVFRVLAPPALPPKPAQ
ncbi:MAG: hypothetical protein KUG75_07320 [Pseudomonadales bacterium]|nr:hypothetical protein [Pseudomonadales bacterium]